MKLSFNTRTVLKDGFCNTASFVPIDITCIPLLFKATLPTKLPDRLYSTVAALVVALAVELIVVTVLL